MKPNKKILYFIRGRVPTAEDIAAAAELGTTMFRNASAVQPDESPETCDGVAGLVPESYAHKDINAPATLDEGDENQPEEVEVSSLTVLELRERLKALEVDFPAQANKATLVALLENAIAEEGE